MHSTLLGGSIAARRINCPASFREQLKAPPGVTSVYAEAGTAMHEAMTYWIEHPSETNLVGRTFNDRVITQEDFDTLLQPAMRAVDELEIIYGGDFQVFDTERQVRFPRVPGAFGTLDLLLDSSDYLLLIDFKFGAGVQVSAVDELGNPNAQLMFYLAGIKSLIRGSKTVVAIVQPTFEPTFTHVIVTPAMLKLFEKNVMRAVQLALSDDPPRQRGEWCRFAPCKVTCPLWTGPLLDLSALGVPKAADHTHNEWGIFLANAKRLIDSALTYQKQIDAALIDHLKAGGRAPGFALKPKATTRKWLEDTKYVAQELAKLGLRDYEIWQPKKLQTFQVLDAAAKRHNRTIPDSLRPKPPATELTLTYEDDPQAVDVQERAAKFAASLKMISKHGE